MLRLRDIMTTDLVTFAPHTSLREAMSVLASRHVSGAPVVDGRSVVGVISSTDLLEFAATDAALPSDREPRDDWDDNEPGSAFFSEMWTDMDEDVVERMNNRARDWERLAEHTVSEVMTRDLRALTTNTTVEEAAAFMRSAGIHRVLVTANDELAGIATTKDITNAVADHRLTAFRYVFGAPSTAS